MNKILRDERDRTFLSLIVHVSVTQLPFALTLLLFPVFSLWLGLIYLALSVYWMGPFTLMLHNLTHRPAFTPRFRWLYHYVVVILGPLYGQTPYTYAAHHIGMHHLEGNLNGDLSSTLPYRRDSLLDFLRYWLDFLFWGPSKLFRYLWAKRRKALFRRALLGETIWYTGIAGLGWLNPQGTLVVFVLPLLVTRFAMMAGNWAQHAFVDPRDPTNTFRNSITCIDTPYNSRCFNDGYHIGHHLRPGMHWSEMPSEFERNRALYEKEKAIVFIGLDYFQVWMLLMLKRYPSLAKRMHSREPLESRIARLQSRTQAAFNGA